MIRILLDLFIINKIYFLQQELCIAVKEGVSLLPSHNWDSESILYTSWWDKNLNKINHSEGAENIDFIYQ